MKICILHLLSVKTVKVFLVSCGLNSNIRFLTLFICLLSLVKNVEGLQLAALDEYGADLHVALHSRKDELRYLRKLTEMLFPYVMPPKSTDCR